MSNLCLVEGNSEARCGRNSQVTVIVKLELVLGNIVEVGTIRDIFDQIRIWHCSGHLQISGETDGSIPSVTDIFDIEMLG